MPVFAYDISLPRCLWCAAITKVVDATGHSAPASMFTVMNLFMRFTHSVGGPDNAILASKACAAMTLAAVVGVAVSYLRR